jgi:p-aminobenzoyl-glutamate transporter AbgT
MPPPAGVTTIAVLFLLVGIYLAGVGLLMLLFPGRVGMVAGAPLLHGLELAGPYMFLLTGVLAGIIGGGLRRLNNWARRLAAAVAILGVVMLIPGVSGALVGGQLGALAWGGLGVMVRVMVAWYLWQAPVVEAFRKS